MTTITATTAAAARPKRKRAQISYCEAIDSDEGAVQDEPIEIETEYHSDTDGTYGTRKVRRKETKLTPKKNKKDSQKPFPFLSLPAELRDQIYELAFCEPNGLTLVSATKSYRRIVCRGDIFSPDEDHYYGRRRRGKYRGRYRISGQSQSQSTEDEISKRQLVPNLLAVNKQIHAEGINFLYGQEIVLDDTMTLHQFLASIGDDNQKRLLELTIKGWGGGRGTHKAMNHCALTLLAGATNLKTLYLDCQIGWMRKPKELARQLYRDGHFFMEAFGKANGSKDAIVDVLELNDWNFDKNNYWSYRASQANLPEQEAFKTQFQQDLRSLLGR